MKYLKSIGRKIFINVELTNYSSPMDDLADKVVSLVKKFNLEESFLISSFNLIALIQARNLLPKVPLGLLTFTGLAELALRSRLVRFGPLLALHPLYKDVTPYLDSNCPQATMSNACIDGQSTGYHEKLFEAGVDGIFTDDPLLARKILAEEIHNNS